MELSPPSESEDCDPALLSCYPEKMAKLSNDNINEKKVSNRESNAETVRCSDLSGTMRSSSFTLPSSSFMIAEQEEDSMLAAENERLKEELSIVTAERDSLKAELAILKLKMETSTSSPDDDDKDGTLEEEEEEEKESAAVAPPPPPKSSPGNNNSFRTSFRLPSFMLRSNNNNNPPGPLLEDLDGLSIDSGSLGVGVSHHSISSTSPRNVTNKKRGSFIGRIFGSTKKNKKNKQATIMEEVDDSNNPSGEVMLDWKRNDVKKTTSKSASPNKGRRSSLMKRIFRPNDPIKKDSSDDDSSNDSSSSNSSSSSDSSKGSNDDEAKDQLEKSPDNTDGVGVVRRMQPRTSSMTRLQRLTAERRDKRESFRISKNFKLAEENVNGLKSCLKRKEEGPKRNVKFRDSVVEVRRVSMIRGSAWDNCFFTEEELAEFKYEAFMEECGLTDDDF
eukprot:scaffold408_cov71-Cylindrotheca_fusiformis.AAC.33